MPKEYTELMHHNYPLALMDLWNYGETLRDVPWSEKQFTISPFCVAERIDGSVHVYYDQEGIEWKKREAGSFDPLLMKQHAIESYGKIKNIVEQHSTLSHEDFLACLEAVKEYWTWFDGMWWMIEHYEETNQPLDDIMEARKATEYFIPGFIAVIRNSLASIFPEHAAYVDVISLHEIINRTLPHTNELEQRLHNYMYANGVLYNSRTEVEDTYDISIRETVIDHTNLKGQSAYNGYACGVVRRVESMEDVHAFQPGEIIVSSTTTPNFLPAIKKASAIVSEHGGAICHAAITARELKKPCVVGVSGVTKALSTGDIVEVNAANGIITHVSDGSLLSDVFRSHLGDHTVLKVEGVFLPLFLMVDWMLFYDVSFTKKLPHNYPVLTVKRDNYFEFYMDHDNWIHIAQEGIQRYIDNSSYKEETHARYIKQKNHIEGLYDRYMHDDNPSEEYQLQVLNEALDLLQEIVAVTTFVDYLDTETLENVYIKNGIKLDFDALYAISDLHDFESFELHTTKDILTYKDTHPDYLMYVYTGYTVAPSVKEVKNTLAQLSVDELHKNIELSEKRIAQNRDEKKRCSQHLSQHEKSFLTFLDWIVAMRDNRKIALNKIDALLYATVSRLYTLWGIDQTYVTCSYCFEVRKGKDFVLTHIDALKARKKEYVNLYFGRDYYVERYSNIEAEMNQARRLAQPEKHIASFTGQIAQKGIVRGYAKIVHNPKESHHFNEGDILVTSMTRPEFVPLMKRASAVVTNEGGIVCHAAIVSRELKKPCIIGTKHATDILKNGDYIEVNANEGIVTIVK